MRIRTRFAPSPTGDLHLGGALVALASWWMARHANGTFVVRVEDLDRPRVVAGSAERVLEDLAWLGLAWDGDVVWQSKRGAAYEEAIAKLAAKGLVYPCDCSRAEIARVASAPHPGEELVYPGSCRDKPHDREMRRDPALRVRVPDADVTIEDEIAGTFVQNLRRDVGDFVLRRADGVFAYQLAVIVDDLASGITDVVRGRDLLSSTPRQAWLASELGAAPPRFWHVPLVVDAEGERLAKRTRGARVRALKEAGVGRDEIIGELSRALGIDDSKATRIAPAGPWRIPERWSRVEG